MNASSATDTEEKSILVWDFPTRVFHWSLAATFAVAYLTAESEIYALVHQICGYLFAALIGFRLVWGLIGTRYARFAEFVRSPATVMAYAGSYLKGKPAHYVGHNPLGAVAIVMMLVLGIGIAVTGWMNVSEVGGDAFEEIHELFANAMLLVVFVHIAGVIASSVLHRENLIRSMVTGYKHGSNDAGIRRGRGIIAILLIAALAAFGWSLSQGKLPALLDTVTVVAAQGDGNAIEAHDKDD